MTRVLENGELTARCSNDRTKFAFTTEDCFVREVIVGMIHSGQFDDCPLGCGAPSSYSE